VLLAVQGAGVGPWSNTKLNVEVAKLQVFDKTSGKILELIIVYKLFLRMIIKKAVVEE